MKLSPAQVERTVSQLQIEAIPDNHPLVPQLNRLFGEHTYFLDQNGLNIVEPADDEPGVSAANASGMGVVVNVANGRTPIRRSSRRTNRSLRKAWSNSKPTAVRR